MTTPFLPVALEQASRLLNHGPTVLVTSAQGAKTRKRRKRGQTPIENGDRPRLRPRGLPMGQSCLWPRSHSCTFVPEPVLVVKRFDRELGAGRVVRRHIIDGCQALGLSSALKYERPYGDTRDVRDLREGASLPMLFALLEYCARPAAERLALLRWTLFQVLIGNTRARPASRRLYSLNIDTERRGPEAASRCRCTASTRRHAPPVHCGGFS